MKRVTIVDVARRAGVSPAAVSLALNKPSRLSPETVERVRETARVLGYVPNPHALALVQKRAGTVGVLVPQTISETFANPYFAEFLRGVGAGCEEKGLSLQLVPPREGSVEKAVSIAPVDGFLVVGLSEEHPGAKPLSRRGVPFVVVDGDAEKAPSVNCDDEGGAYAAARSLARRHRKILVLGFPRSSGEHERFVWGVEKRRLRGYRRALEEYGITWTANSVTASAVSPEGGEEAFARAFDRLSRAGRRPTAVLAASDATAFGVLRAAGRLGLRIPEDLEVIGFDDVPFAALCNPPLTTVRQPIEKKGRIAAGLLLDLLEEEDRPVAEARLLPTRLVLRNTTV